MEQQEPPAAARRVARGAKQSRLRACARAKGAGALPANLRRQPTGRGAPQRQAKAHHSDRVKAE